MSWRYKLGKPSDQHMSTLIRYRKYRGNAVRQIRDIRRAQKFWLPWIANHADRLKPRIDKYADSRMAECRQRQRQILPLQMLLRDLRMSLYYGKPNPRGNKR